MKNKPRRPFIEHRVLEIFDLEKNLEKVEKLEKSLKKFIKKCELMIVSEQGHNFKSHGFTKVYILSESHIIFHSWPEDNYLNVDLMSCRKLMPVEKMKNLVKEVFRSEKMQIKNVEYN